MCDVHSTSLETPKTGKNNELFPFIAFNWITGKPTSHDGDQRIAEAELGPGEVAAASEGGCSGGQLPNQPQRKYSTYGRPSKLQKGTSKQQMIKMAKKIGKYSIDI